MSRLSRLTRPAAAAGIVVAALGVSAGPAAAASSPTGGSAGYLELNCVNVSGSSYSAVFGYNDTSGVSGTIAVGPSNTVTPSSVNGEQTTAFQTGDHPAAWESSEVPVGQSITWTVGSPGYGFGTVTATASSPACGGGLALPADGNGFGVPIGLAISVPVGAAVVLFERRARRRRAARRSADRLG